MKMNRIIVAMLGLAAIASAQDVSYNFDQDADFSKFKTYKWVSIGEGVKLDDITAKQLVTALDTQLAMKGLTKTESDGANLYIGYQLALNQEKQITSYNTGAGWGYGPRWGGYGYGGGITSATTSTLTVGSLALDMYDPGQKRLVWRGTATKTIDGGAKPDKRQKNINKAAEKLLKNYPPKKKK